MGEAPIVVGNLAQFRDAKRFLRGSVALVAMLYLWVGMESAAGATNIHSCSKIHDRQELH